LTRLGRRSYFSALLKRSYKLRREEEKRMKKFVAGLLSIMLVLAILGCGKQEAEQPDTGAAGQAEEAADTTRLDSAAVVDTTAVDTAAEVMEEAAETEAPSGN